MIGAGSVVSKDIPDNSVAVGNPIKIIGTYADFVENIRTRCKNVQFTIHCGLIKLGMKKSRCEKILLTVLDMIYKMAQ